MATNLKSVKAAALTSVINSVVSSGVKITGLTYIGSATAANPAGSETVTVAGSGFNSGATVYIDTTSCATTYVSATSLTFTSPAKSVGSYHLYVYNTDGSSGILPSGFVSSSIPIWVTASGAITPAPTNSAYSQTISATGDGSITYSITSGSLPNGLSLNSSTGAITGTAPGSEGTSTFTITASDSQNQTASRSFSIAVVTYIPIDYLLVAGGGGGGSYYGTGGGGAGGLLESIGLLTMNPGSSITVTVGAGGVGGDYYTDATDNRGANGANSSISGATISTVTAIGGGGGAAYGNSGSGNTNGKNGGSGGGLAFTDIGKGTEGLGVYPGSSYISAPRQGYNGGGSTTMAAGGGGGGGGATGGFGSAGPTAGNGGIGYSSSLSGSATYYAGGGGGAAGNGGTRGIGGSGGGGNGSAGHTSQTSTGTAGSPNTGGGGGSMSLVTQGYSGGSGIVIIRYADSYAAAASTTGSPTITTAGGYRVYKFTASGSITF